ncbi:MAG: hypothetical protein Q7S97_07170 [Polaromonas sp.]|nr:hypothetical protein [Polaromonas sp.]
MATKTKTLTTTTAAATKKPSALTPDDKARLALMPSLNSAAVIQAYQGNVMGKDVDVNLMVDHLRTTFTEVKGGDLHTMEAMLISQATALQTIFTSLARRAHEQEYQKNLEAFLGLALKAQAQSRATISALVDLKYPRQATFVKQANIANGPQQVNNGAAAGGNPEQYAQAHTHAEKSAPEQNKLLEEDHGQPGQRMDTRAAQTAERSYQAVETVESVHRAKKPRG